MLFGFKVVTIKTNVHNIESVEKKIIVNRTTKYAKLSICWDFVCLSSFFRFVRRRIFDVRRLTKNNFVLFSLNLNFSRNSINKIFRPFFFVRSLILFDRPFRPLRRSHSLPRARYAATHTKHSIRIFHIIFFLLSCIA